MKTILLVEDNPDDVILTKRVFARSRVANHIVVAEDGAVALDCLFGKGQYEGKPVTPELILLDLNMPKIGGLEVLEKLQADKKLSLIPVVVMTTSIEEEDVLKSYKFGANSFIRKPVDFEQFTTAIEQLGLYWLVLNQSTPSAE